MNFQNDKYTLKFADESDNDGIKRVYESGHFPGNLSVRFLRNPSPYESFLADCKESRVMVIRDNEIDDVIAVGGAVIRDEYVAGRISKCAYMTGLKIHPDYQKKITFIAQSYQFLREGLRECEHCYTTILDDNIGAIKLLEKKRKNMPNYHYLGHYTTYCFHGGKRKMSINSISDSELYKVLEGEKSENLSESASQSIRQVFEELKKDTFSPADYSLMGFGKKKFYYAEKDGEVIAACFVGDQTMYKQYEMCEYGGIYKILSKLPTNLIGYPKFPKPNRVIKHGVVSYLYVKDDDEKILKNFLKSVSKDAGYELMLWGCFENHNLKAAMDKYKTVHYGSRLYEVDWDKREDVNAEKLLKEYGTIGVEVALL